MTIIDVIGGIIIIALCYLLYGVLDVITYHLNLASFKRWLEKNDLTKNND